MTHPRRKETRPGPVAAAALGLSRWSPVPSCHRPTSDRAQEPRLDPGTIQVSARRSRHRAYAAVANPGPDCLEAGRIWALPITAGFVLRDILHP